MGRFVRIDFDEEECDCMALACEAIEQVARMNNMNSANEQLTRVVLARVRAKLNISASLFKHGKAAPSDFEVAQSLPPWLRKQ